MQFRGHRNQFLIISLLLMLVCVQTFSMHFHFPADTADHHNHAHAHTHAPGGVDADHLGTGHDDEATSDFPGVIAKLTHLIGIFVFILLTLVAVAQTRLCIRKWMRRKRPRYYLLYYRPPLRAPPL